MAMTVRGVFDLGRGLGVADPRQEEARAREASSRAERDLRSSIAARLVNQQAQQQAVGLQREQMAQQESQFSRGQQFEGQQAQAQRGWQELMQREGFDFTRGENALNRGQQESQFGRSQQSAADQFIQRMQLEQGGQQQADRHFYENMGFMRERGGVEDRFRDRDFQQRGEQFDRGQQGEQDRFDTGQRNQMALARAGMYQREYERESQQRSATDAEAQAALAPLLGAIESGGGLDPNNADVQRARQIALLRPDVGQAMERLVGEYARGRVNNRFGQDSAEGEQRRANLVGNPLRHPLDAIGFGISAFGQNTADAFGGDNPIEARSRSLQQVENLFGQYRQGQVSESAFEARLRRWLGEPPGR